MEFNWETGHLNFIFPSILFVNIDNIIDLLLVLIIVKYFVCASLI